MSYTDIGIIRIGTAVYKEDAFLLLGIKREQKDCSCAWKFIV